MSAFLVFTLHNKKGPVYVKPAEIVSFCYAPEGGTRIVTRQKQTYYVLEELDEVSQEIEDFFDQKFNQ